LQIQVRYEQIAYKKVCGYRTCEKKFLRVLPSETVSSFAEWIFGGNQAEKIMTGSYSERLSATFAKSVRDTIPEVKADKNRIFYSGIFP
jgi:hypothetical protein